jgi:hypothetical protein
MYVCVGGVPSWSKKPPLRAMTSRLSRNDKKSPPESGLGLAGAQSHQSALLLCSRDLCILCASFLYTHRRFPIWLMKLLSLLK